MYFRDMTDPLLTDDQEFQYLGNRLEQNDISFRDIKLPKGCTPDTVKVTFSRNNGYTLSIEPRITYSGPDASFARLCRNQRMSFQSMDEMKTFLRSMKLEPPGSIISIPDCPQEKPSHSRHVKAADSKELQAQKGPDMDAIKRCRTAAMAVLNYIQDKRPTE